MEWNLNNTIWVKVKPEGYEHLKNQPYIDGWLPIWEKLIEKGAYIPMPMHQLISLFGNISGALGHYVYMVCYLEVPDDVGIIPFNEVK